MLDVTDPRFDNVDWMALMGIEYKGYDARQAGEPQTANPYDFGSPDAQTAASAQSWLDGWEQADDEIDFSENG
jgi:ribosome modulation factor